MYDVTKLNDKELEKLEKRLEKQYKEASEELDKMAQDYFKQYADRWKREHLAMETTTLDEDQIRAKWVSLYGSDKGFKRWYNDANCAYGKTEAEAKRRFEEWEISQIGRGQHWEELRDQMAQRMTDTNQIAQGYVNSILPSMYCSESNSVARIGQESAMEQGVMGIKFDLVDEHTVERLMAGSREVRPYKKIEINLPRDKQWNLTKLQNALLQGILQGDDIGKIAGRFEAVVGMNRASAIRNARTAVTGARSAGKQDRFDDLAKQGCVFSKIWVATDDERTREEHLEADGQVVDYDLPFDVGGEELMYPADPAGSPWNIYNCRCTMKTGKPQFHSIRSRINDDDLIGASPNGNNQVSSVNDDRQYNKITEYMQANNYARNEIKKYSTMPSDAEIIDHVGGYDDKGRCVSLALAYIGNRLGYDVTDLRTDGSEGYIAKRSTVYKLATMDGVSSEIIDRKNIVKAGKELLGMVEQDKEYMFTCGNHSAIVRNSGGTLQYLELQLDTANGWTNFSDNLDNTLKEIFNASEYRIKSGKSYLIDINSFGGNEEFTELLSYINNTR